MLPRTEHKAGARSRARGRQLPCKGAACAQAERQGVLGEWGQKNMNRGWGGSVQGATGRKGLKGRD